MMSRDSLTRSFVDIDYYVQLGEHAYVSLARQGDGTFGDVLTNFQESPRRLSRCWEKPASEPR